MVHWWDNTTTRLHVEFYPHAITCLPVRKANYRLLDGGFPQKFEYARVAFAVDAFVGAADRVEFALSGVNAEEPTGIVDIEQ